MPPDPPAPPGMANAYVEQPSAQPSGQYGQPYPAYGQQPYGTGAPAEPNVSAIILTILSGLSLSTCVIGIPSLIIGIMALSSNRTDPVGSRKMAKTGWIVYAINAGVVAISTVLAVIFIVVFVVAFAEPTTTIPSKP